MPSAAGSAAACRSRHEALLRVFEELGLHVWFWYEKFREEFCREDVIIAVDVWITTPFMVLLILAGLQMLPKSIYEAASIDGVSEWRQFTALTLPLLAPSIAVAVLFRLLDALRMFDLSFVLSSNSDDTKTVSIYAREVLVNFQDMGVGSAASAAIFLMIAVVTAIYVTVFRLNRKLLEV